MGVEFRRWLWTRSHRTSSATVTPYDVLWVNGTATAGRCWAERGITVLHQGFERNTLADVWWTGCEKVRRSEEYQLGDSCNSPGKREYWFGLGWCRVRIWWTLVPGSWEVASNPWTFLGDRNVLFSWWTLIIDTNRVTHKRPLLSLRWEDDSEWWLFRPERPTVWLEDWDFELHTNQPDL